MKFVVHGIMYCHWNIIKLVSGVHVLLSQDMPISCIISCFPRHTVMIFTRSDSVLKQIVYRVVFYTSITHHYHFLSC